MRFNQAASGRQARTVRILANLPLLVQDKSSRIKRGKRIETIRLPHATIIIWQTASGDIAIEIEPQ